MKRKVELFLLVVIEICFYSHIEAGGFSFYASNDFYLYQDRIDTTKKGGDLFVDIGMNLNNIRGSGFSFNSDVKLANNCYSPALEADYRSPYEFISAYLEWINSSSVFMVRGGRQPYTNLLSEYFSFDGVRLEIQPLPHRVAINFVAGSVTPIPYLKRALTTKDSTYLENPLEPNLLKDTIITKISNKYPLFSDKGIFSLDGVVNISPMNSINIGTGIIPLSFERKIVKYDSLDTLEGGNESTDSIRGKVTKEKYDFRVAIGGDFSPISFFRINGSGRYSLVQNGFDRYDLRIKLLPSSTIEILTYLTGEQGRVDSTNYFSIMFYRQLTEWGVSFYGFPSENSSIELDYHITNVNKEGSDHFFSFSASTAHLTGGITLGVGAHGFTLKPYGGFELPFLKFFSLVGNAEYTRVDETDEDNIHFMTLFSAGLKANFYPIGLSFYPRVEYISNRYYKQDVRFLLTTNLLISGFKGSDK